MPAKPVTGSGAGAWADEVCMTFRVADPEHALAGVRLQADVGIAADQLEFRRDEDGWELVLGRPPVKRIEYLLELQYAGGGAKVGPDPANPRTVAGAFGPKSVLEFPGYTPPAWLSGAAEPGISRRLDVPALDGTVSARIWSPAASPDSELLPLLVAHDGPEYDTLAGLTRYLGAGVLGGWLPPLRAALLGPGPRDSWYSASPRYASALRRLVLPALGRQVATSTRIGMGASLGALAMLHAYGRYPDSFDALFLQSGSFFMPRLDDQERRFPYYRRITSFTAGVHAGRLPARPVPVVLTCGASEENVANNRLVAQALRAHGYPAILHELPDLHNFTAWRDAFDPYLTDLLREVSP